MAGVAGSTPAVESAPLRAAGLCSVEPFDEYFACDGRIDGQFRLAHPDHARGQLLHERYFGFGNKSEYRQRVVARAVVTAQTYDPSLLAPFQLLEGNDPFR